MSRDWQTILSEHQRVIAEMATLGLALDQVVETLLQCFKNGGRVYLLGNGGSAADAQHIAAELLGRFKKNRRALPAVALTTDTSTLTAIGNDLGFEQVFARQLEGLLRPGDVVWALSTSGNSPNVLAAVRLAAARGATVIGFTGAAGGELASLCNHLVRIAHHASDRIQEGHLLAYHYICERVEAAVENSE